jgi:hypothetical protein
MQIKITPLNPMESQLEAVFRTRNYYYLAQFHSAGIVTEIKSGDDWLDGEMAWVSRSEMPFVTAIRHCQLVEPHLVQGAATPILRRYKPFYVLETVDEFPPNDQCMQLIYKYCDHAGDRAYNFHRRDVDVAIVEQLVERFDYDNDLLIRAASCLFKAYVLLASSHTFAEEIYINVFIALDAMVEHLISARNLKGGAARNRVIDIIGKFVKIDEPGVDFADYEEEMRDGIRNNIIHPLRHRSGERVAQPFLMADYIFEDLGFVDWLFKKVIEGKLS